MLGRSRGGGRSRLRGKTVAVPFGSTSQFYLNALLKEADLSEADLDVGDLQGDQGGEAFLLQEVDAAVTFEPWLTQAKNAEHGHLLTDTSQRPGLLVDCVVTTADILRDRQAEFRSFGRAWDAAVDYVAAHPNEVSYEMDASLPSPASA